MLTLAAGLHPGVSAKLALTIVVSHEIAPPGGSAQIKVSLEAPRQIVTGNLSIDFDPSVFGQVANVAVLSATGDAGGYAHVRGTHVDAQFSSASGSIGQLPGLPVFVISIPVLTSAPNGKILSLTVDPSGADWDDPAGNTYSTTVVPGVFQVGGSLSVQNVTPGGGLLPRGSVVQINGTGFDPSTAVAMDGVSLASVNRVNAQQMELTLGADTEITAKRLSLTNADGQQTEYFPALPSTPSDWAAPVQPLVPLTAYTMVRLYYSFGHSLSSQLVGLLNQTSTPVTATFFSILSGKPFLLQTITIPAGQLFFPSISQMSPPPQVYMVASAAIRMIEYSQDFTSGQPLFQERALSPTPVSSLSGLSFLTLPSQPVVWNWSTGNGSPSPVQIGLNYPADYSVSVSPSTPRWLSVTPAQGTAPATVSLAPSVSSLANGVYTATVAISSTFPPPLNEVPSQVFTFEVTLSVGASLIQTAYNYQIGFSAPADGSLPRPAFVQLTPDSPGFTVGVSTTSGGNWLAATPTKGTAADIITVSADPAGLSPGTYAGRLDLRGPANTVSIPVNLSIDFPVYTSFVLAPGTSLPAQFGQLISSPGGAIISFSVQTDAGGDWLKAISVDSSHLQVGASASGLSPGVYQGTVAVTAASSSTRVYATLTVLGPPSASLALAPSSLFLTAPVGQTSKQFLSVNSPGGPALFQWTSSVAGATTNVTMINSGVQSTSPAPAVVAPATLQVEAGAPQPGTYYGGITVTWDGGSVTVPVTLSVTAAAPFSPLITAVVNSASERPAAIAPGEILSLFGQGIGPSPAGFTLDANGKLPGEISGTQVLINGTAAPLLYVSASQVNAIVPYDLAGAEIATLQTVYNGLASASWGVPVATASPALFTLDSSGVGQASVLNQDNSVNGPSNAAARGSLVQIFATGGGGTTPASATGSLAGGNPTTLPAAVTIGSMDSPVMYHGSAPGEVAGLIQVNAQVPLGVTPGPAVPIVLSVGGQPSQAGVTIAVK